MRHETLAGAFCAVAVLIATLISFTFGFDHAPLIIGGAAIVSMAMVAAVYRFGSKGLYVSMFLLPVAPMVFGFIVKSQPIFSVGVGVAAGAIAAVVADRVARAKQRRQQQDRAKREYDAYHSRN